MQSSIIISGNKSTSFKINSKIHTGILTKYNNGNGSVYKITFKTKKDAIAALNIAYKSIKNELVNEYGSSEDINDLITYSRGHMLNYDSATAEIG